MGGAAAPLAPPARTPMKADQRLTRISSSFVKKKTFLWIIFSIIFKSVQSSASWKNEAFTTECKFRNNPPRLARLSQPSFEQPGPGTVKKQTVDKVLDVIINFISYWEFHM